MIQKLTKWFVVMKKKLSKPKLQEESKDVIKFLRNLFKLKKENKEITDKTNGDIRNLFELKNKDITNR